MVNLGYMLPSDEKHDKMMQELANDREHSIEEILRNMIEKEYRETFGKDALFSILEG